MIIAVTATMLSRYLSYEICIASGKVAEKATYTHAVTHAHAIASRSILLPVWQQLNFLLDVSGMTGMKQHSHQFT